MTDHINYTALPEVLAACGWKEHPNFGWYNADFSCVQKWEIQLTMQELWDGLCKACKEAGHRWNPEISGLAAVLVNPDDTDGRGFVSSEYGTLSNAIAAALYYVLQQDEKKEG